MKRIIILGLLISSFIGCKKGEKMDTRQIEMTINNFFVSVDNRDWDKVKLIFNDSVLLDYTSMTGGQPSTLTSSQIIDSWKGILPGFDNTHHQLGNYIFEYIDNNFVKVICYGTATHYLKNKSNNNLWTVVGSYDFELKYIKSSWKIQKMKFNLKYIDGNMDLPKMAQDKLK